MKKIILFISIFSVSCASVYNVSPGIKLDKKAVFAVLPFVNTTQTEMAGLKVKNLVENYLYSKKNQVLPLNDFGDKEYFSEKDLSTVFASAKDSGADYIFYGYVNEWKYKAGIDAEPTVSLTVNLYDVKQAKVVWSASGSKSALSYKSAGLVSQKLVEKLLSGFKE